MPWWWTWKIHLGQPIIRGPYDDEREANVRGLEELKDDFEVVKLFTRDPDRARGIIKDMILRRTGDIDQALRRFRHQPPEESSEAGRVHETQEGG